MACVWKMQCRPDERFALGAAVLSRLDADLAST
jgi:hypothetical protein